MGHTEGASGVCAITKVCNKIVLIKKYVLAVFVCLHDISCLQFVN